MTATECSMFAYMEYTLGIPCIGKDVDGQLLEHEDGTEEWVSQEKFDSEYNVL